MRLLCFVIALFLISPVNAKEYALEDVIAEVNTAVVSVAADAADDVQSLGAGIIIGADGYVVTNAHVCENAEKITVITSDDTEYAADLIGADVKTDIALLKVQHPQGFEPAKFTDSDKTRVGNQVFAIGNPFGLGNSVSLGIISAKERDIEKGPYDNFIQTDTAINQGNSGGPLFNTEGEIVGMNTAIFSTDGKNMGVGFATPANIVRWVAEELKQNGKVVRGWLGIGVQKVNPENKLAIASLIEGSPAETAGLKVGDVLEKVSDFTLNNPRLFSLKVAQSKPDSELSITITRDGEPLEFVVKVAEMPSDKTNSIDKTGKTSNEKPDYDALHLDEEQVKSAVDFVDLGFKAYYDEEQKYFAVVDVKPDSEAYRKGIRAGDRFKTIDGKQIFGIADLQTKIKQATDNGKATLQFISPDTVDTITLNLRKSDEQN